MLKHLWICAALVAFVAGPAYAQKQEAVLQHIAIPGGEFDFVLAVPKPGAGALADLGNTPDALIVHLHGGELALAFEDAGEMLKALESLQSPVSAFRTAGRGDDSARPVALYIVPKVRGLPPGGEMMTLKEFEVYRGQTAVATPERSAGIQPAETNASLR